MKGDGQSRAHDHAIVDIKRCSRRVNNAKDPLAASVPSQADARLTRRPGLKKEKKQRKKRNIQDKDP